MSGKQEPSQQPRRSSRIRKKPKKSKNTSKTEKKQLRSYQPKTPSTSKTKKKNKKIKRTSRRRSLSRRRKKSTTTVGQGNGVDQPYRSTVRQIQYEQKKTNQRRTHPYRQEIASKTEQITQKEMSQMTDMYLRTMQFQV
eukprot:573266_1